MLVKLNLFFLKSALKQTDVPLKLKFNESRLYPTNSVKYLGAKSNENLNWKHCFGCPIHKVRTQVRRGHRVWTKAYNYCFGEVTVLLKCAKKGGGQIFGLFESTHFMDGHLSKLILSWRRPLSYRNQSIDLPNKSMDWFLYYRGLCHERVKALYVQKNSESNLSHHNCTPLTLFLFCLAT